MLFAEHITKNCKCSPQVTVRAWRERGCTMVARSLDSSRSNGHGETWEEFSQLHVISEVNTSTPWFFFSFLKFFLTISVLYPYLLFLDLWIKNELRKLEVKKAREEGDGLWNPIPHHHCSPSFTNFSKKYIGR